MAPPARRARVSRPAPPPARARVSARRRGRIRRGAGGWPARVSLAGWRAVPVWRARAARAGTGAPHGRGAASRRRSRRCARQLRPAPPIVAIDDDLRRVDLGPAGVSGQQLLARRDLGAGKSVGPAQPVPVADVKSQRQQVGAGFQRRQPAVGRRAGAAALGGVELDHRRRRARGAHTAGGSTGGGRLRQRWHGGQVEQGHEDRAVRVQAELHGQGFGVAV